MAINVSRLERLSAADIFQAAYPKHMKKSLISKIAKLVYDIFSVIIFPIAICRYIHYKIHTFLGHYMFVPSQFISKTIKTTNWFVNPIKEVKQKKYLRQGRQKLKEVFNAEIVNIKTADGAKLNGVFVPGKDPYGRELKKDGPLIIHFLGQGAKYEDLGHYKEVLSSIKNHNVLVFNERGVVKSSSVATRKGLFLDAEAILQFAKKRLNVPKEKMILHGHSFGGVKATYLASKHRDLKLLNDRSFASSEKAVYYMTVEELFYSAFSYCLMMPYILMLKFAPQKIVNIVQGFVEKHEICDDKKLQKPIIVIKLIRAISSVIAFIFAKFTVLFGWGLYPEKDWQKVKAKKFILFLPNDEKIPYEASFFKAVKKTEKQFIRILDPNCLHWTAISQDIFNEALNFLKD
ncbi:MAG: hypothetical protein KR126chlam4_00008 [Candidatus Anoxychlamydiales bacterium]|nr:hypothetical protein [Candidatus Anoxychlamydiales bacterium]NGX40192.1 hypothetical protein [Candidatus Anoxychlamydiales bacterium]